ncbi:MAG: hypothetical protein ACYDER_16310 [Ktedonobacteraceae bacterium]
MGQVIKHGILQSFNSGNYTASVLLLEATSAFLTGVSVSNAVDGTSALPGALCAVLFFDEHNPQDAVVLAVFPNSTQGIPSPAPGRITFVPTYLQVNADSIGAGVTNTYTLTGGTSGIPTGILGVLYKAFYTSASVGAYVQLGPHGVSSLAGYAALGTMPVASGIINGMGIIQVDSSGRIDVKANAATCVFTLYTHGYVI